MKLPPLRTSAWLVGVLFEIGPSVPTGGGIGPITQQELMAWQFNSSVRLRPDEAKTLRRLSTDYVRELSLGEAIDSKPPWKHCGVTANTIQARLKRDSLRASVRAKAKPE